MKKELLPSLFYAYDFFVPQMDYFELVISSLRINAVRKKLVSVEREREKDKKIRKKIRKYNKISFL